MKPSTATIIALVLLLLAAIAGCQVLMWDYENVISEMEME